MASNETHPSAACPAELVRAVTRDAEADAERVIDFFQRHGVHPTAEQPLLCPPAFLLDLGAALRLLAWQQAGLDPTALGLPCGRQALLDVLRAARNPLGDPPADPSATLAGRVLTATVEHFAWNGRAELDADVLLGPADEAALLTALADFLWAHRPR